MYEATYTNIQRPRTDEKPLFDILFGANAIRVLLVAHELKFFSILDNKDLFKGFCPKTQQSLLGAIHF